jgi:hypothetical protein
LFFSPEEKYSSHFARHLFFTKTSVGDPDPHVFGPPRSGPVSQREVKVKVLSGQKKIMLAK